MTFDEKSRRWLLLLAFAACVARLPGAFWGANFPGGWQGHHIDENQHWVIAETIVDPSWARRWYHPYPKGMAAHAAVPLIGARALRGRLSFPPSTKQSIVTTGRLVAVAYGTATVVLMFFFARLLFRDRRRAIAGAAFLALGGLHATQSHFFLADVPALFWFLCGAYTLYRYALDETPNRNHLLFGCFAFGVAFGIKLFPIGLPTLALLTLLRRPRVWNVVQGLLHFVAGFLIVNLGWYSPKELLDTLASGTNDPFLWTVGDNLLLYAIELPSLIGAVALALALGAVWPLFRRWWCSLERRRVALGVVVLLPLAIQLAFIVFKYDHFLRHTLPLVPWVALLAGWSLIELADRLKPAHHKLLFGAVFAYQAAFVFDGERVFIEEPRNEAAAWLFENVEKDTTVWWRWAGVLVGYRPMSFPTQGRPDTLVVEMHYANNYLSGMGWRDSYPPDARHIFDAEDHGGAEGIRELQRLFRGETEYTEVARFSERYFMPEYVVVDRLIGNRARNYVAEIAIFRRGAATSTTTAGGP